MRVLMIGMIFILVSCSTKQWGEQYPHCFHQNDAVVKKCIELNDAGSGVKAAEVEQQMKNSGEIE